MMHLLFSVKNWGQRSSGSSNTSLKIAPKEQQSFVFATIYSFTLRLLRVLRMLKKTQIKEPHGVDFFHGPLNDRN